MLTIHTELMQVRDGTNTRVTTPESVYGVCQDMATCAQEMFVSITLNTKNKMIARNLVTLGLLDSAPVSAREVFRKAISDSAAAIIIVHNHPSGDCLPSAEDLRVTRQLVDAGRVVGVRVLDHIIIGRGDVPYVSMREKGLVDFDMT